MNQVKVSKEDCPPSCEQIRFITSEIHQKIDPIKECEKGDVAESIIANYIHMNRNSRGNNGLPTNIPESDYFWKPSILQFYEKMVEHNHSKENVRLEVAVEATLHDAALMDNIKETCIALLSQDVARVSIMFESDYYVLTNTNVRITFFDQLSALGKIFKKYFMHTYY